MPVFTFRCTMPLCEREHRKLLPKAGSIICGCGLELQPELPSSVATVTREMKDPRRGVTHPKGLKQQMTKRMNQHHDRHDAERKIDEFGMDDARRLGWDKKVKRL